MRNGMDVCCKPWTSMGYLRNSAATYMAHAFSTWVHLLQVCLRRHVTSTWLNSEYLHSGRWKKELRKMNINEFSRLVVLHVSMKTEIRNVLTVWCYDRSTPKLLRFMCASSQISLFERTPSHAVRTQFLRPTISSLPPCHLRPSVTCFSYLAVPCYFFQFASRDYSSTVIQYANQQISYWMLYPHPFSPYSANYHQHVTRRHHYMEIENKAVPF